MKSCELLCLALLGSILTVIGDMLLKRGSGLEHPRYFALGVALYAAAAVPVAVLFKKTDFSVVFIVWEAVTVVVAIAVARVFYHEQLVMSRILAVAFAIAAVLLGR